MGTTSRGIVYSDPSGIPKRADIQTLAESADAAIAAVAALLGGQKVQHGSISISGTSVAAGGQVNSAVTFPSAFTGTPRVFVSMTSAPAGTNYLVARTAGSTTSTGFSIYVYNTGTAAATWTNLPISWFAIGPA